DTSGAFCNDALPPLPIRALVASASRGFLTNSNRGHRIYRKVAGTLCQRAREELGAAGLFWSRAAWDGSLRAAMAGLKALAGTADAGLEQGLKEVLTLITQAHLEGLRRPASASRGAHKTAASRAHPSRAATKQAWSPAGGASRKAREAREELATYLFGDKVPYGLLCKHCSSPAIFARRGGKVGGGFECFCKKHYEQKNPGNPGCFELEKTRAEWARVCEVRKAKAELAQALDEDTELRREHVCDGYQRDSFCWDATPKSRNLIAKLLLIGGIESNPGWPASQSQGNENKDGPAPNVSLRRPLVILPSREDVERIWQPECDERGVPEEFLEYLKRKQQMNPSLAIHEGRPAPEKCDRGVNKGIARSEFSGEKPSANKTQDDKELDHQDMVEKGPFTALVESSSADEGSQLSTSVRGIARVADESNGCGATKEESGGNNRPATSAADESNLERSGSEEEGEDIEGAEFESMSESPDEETSQDREMIDDGSQVEENPVIAQGRIRAVMGSDSESDVSQLLGRRLKPRAPGRATKAFRTRRRPVSSPPPSKSSAKEGSPSRCSGSAASDGKWAWPQADQAGLVPTAMETDSEFDELPARLKRRVSDGAARS
ncbi:hypothetical protein KFL_014940010, partial [Klebsormidium nitens]